MEENQAVEVKPKKKPKWHAFVIRDEAEAGDDVGEATVISADSKPSLLKTLRESGDSLNVIAVVKGHRRQVARSFSF